jgi:hypothetical protein
VIRQLLLCHHSHSTILPLDLGCVYNFTALATTDERDKRGLVPLLNLEEALLREASILVDVGADRSVVDWTERGLDSGWQLPWIR